MQCQPPSPARKRCRHARSTLLRDRLQDRVVPDRESLEDIGAACADGPGGVPREPAAGKDSSSSEDDAEPARAAQATRARSLRNRSAARARGYLKSALGLGPTLSFLELQAVSKKVNEDYVTFLDRFLTWADQRDEALDADTAVDEALVQWFNALYFQGHLPHVGEKTLAALMHRDSHFGKRGRGAIPRSLRALTGWRRKCPARSRLPLPWGFWTAMAGHLAQKGLVRMAVLTLLLVDAYLRPCDALPLRAGQLLPPALGISPVWALLLHPSEFGEVGKTGESDDTILLDSRHLQWMAVLWEILHDQPSDTLVFGFGYASYFKEFKKVATALGVPEAVPYQARHSGPSIDLALRRRTLDSAKKRGRWRTDRSLHRYEKAGRLQQVANRWTEVQRAHFNRSAELVEALILGRGGAQLPSAKLV